MQPAKRARELAPEEKRSTGVKQFRSAARVVDGIKPAPSLNEARSGLSGMFDTVSDDDIARIMEFMLEMPPPRMGVLDMLDAAAQTRAAVVHFSLCCTRFASVLRSIATKVKTEVVARGATKISPIQLDCAYPFTKQMRSEMLSVDQFKMLRAAQNSMACHCAKACCLKYQKAFNKDIKKGDVFKTPSSPRLAPRLIPFPVNESRVVPVLESCNLLAATPEGDSAFAYFRKRMSKVGVHGDSRGRRFVETIAKIKKSSDAKDTRFTIVAETELDTTDVSAPLTMRSSNDGTAVAYIAAVHPGTDEQSAFSTAFVWEPGYEAIELKQPTGCFAERVCLSAQDAWFIDGSDGTTTIVVAWSTDYVHTSGHHVGSNALPEHGPAYVFATYTLEEGCAEQCDVTSFYSHLQLISCSATNSGSSVLVLAKKTSTYDSTSKRICYLHDIANDSIRILGGGSQTVRGPLVAALSPSGDCAITINRTNDSIVVDVMVRTCRDAFSSMQTIDLSTWIDLSPNDTAPSSDLVKAALGITFSYCGRFVAILDRHPLFGDTPTNHGLVVIDMALRMDKFKALRPHPLFPSEEQAPRALQWTKSGVWVLPPGTDENGAIGARGGALMLHCPRASSLM